MSSHSHDHDHGEAEPVTDRTHDNSWSANLEKPQYEDDRSLLERHAVEAVERTTGGHHVNLVTHAAQGHPEDYLYDALESNYGDDDVEWEYVEQCGCGGHVVRVHVN
ncbi:putative rSAM target protein, CGCGG family [Halomicrobium zhouii]|uniref:Putative rSAM target protein, CGCGG family n=1 Tax=Halomicrobium zhouii TaxID=767519 RepID=A0A1I6M465_9EURY|nr:CGCGG family rSAM-modified RiPP protein [Halomicrobium zhouii]SFS10428.1 putative rSAM target protein, CGCGG family [Halomicrobium zhouii]